MSQALAESVRLCRSTALRAASNFSYTFLFLPRAKREAMYALYAFLRRTDDLGDSSGDIHSRREALAAWRASLERAFSGTFDDPLLPALVDTVHRYRIPREHLTAVLDGVEMDLDGRRYESFADLELYCHRVASAVGLACIHIWGFRDPAALQPARACGVAFQLTNILRDLPDDLAAGRVYLPSEDQRRFDCTLAPYQRPVCDARFRALIRFEISLAEQFYDSAASLGDWLDASGRRAFSAMYLTYRGLLEEIRRRDGDVLQSRVRIGRWRKLAIAARCLIAPPRLANSDTLTDSAPHIPTEAARQ